MDWQLILVYIVAAITLLFIIRWIVGIIRRANEHDKTGCVGCRGCACAASKEKLKRNKSLHKH